MFVWTDVGKHATLGIVIVTLWIWIWIWIFWQKDLAM